MHSVAEWSSLVARQAHNLKVAGSNPASATCLSGNFLLAVSLCGFFGGGIVSV